MAESLSEKLGLPDATEVARWTHNVTRHGGTKAGAKQVEADRTGGAVNVCASLIPGTRYYRSFGAVGCRGRGNFGRWKYDSEMKWREIPCPACALRRSLSESAPPPLASAAESPPTDGFAAFRK